MTFPGMGGQQPAPYNAPPAQTPVPGITPGVPPILTVTEIIVVPGGTLEGIFTYSSNPPAAGTLIDSSSVAADGTDKYGNHFLSGTTTYSSGTATQLDSGQLTFYTGSLAAGWSVAAQIFISGAVIELITSGGVITSNNTLDNGSGSATINGNLTVSTINGSADTGSSGLPDGTIHGTSGGASAGTAHTHSPGSFAVGNGVHVHTI